MEMEKRIEEIQFPRLVKKEIPSKEFMNRIRSYPAKENTITMWALGQNGYILKTPEDVLIAIDPYLTDYCASKRTGIRTERSRILPVFIEPEDLAVDVMVITHSHCDHADPFTLERYAWKERTIFLAPWQAVQVLKEAGIPNELIIKPGGSHGWNNSEEQDLKFIAWFDKYLK